MASSIYQHYFVVIVPDGRALSRQKQKESLISHGKCHSTGSSEESIRQSGQIVSDGHLLYGLLFNMPWRRQPLLHPHRWKSAAT